VVDDKESFLMARRLTREEGILAGGSSGSALVAALRVAQAVDDPDALVVVLLPDTGRNYLSKIFNEEWMRSNGFLEQFPTHSVGEMVGQRVSGSGLPPFVGVQARDGTREALRVIGDQRVLCVGGLHALGADRRGDDREAGGGFFSSSAGFFSSRIGGSSSAADEATAIGSTVSISIPVLNPNQSVAIVVHTRIRPDTTVDKIDNIAILDAPYQGQGEASLPIVHQLPRTGEHPDDPAPTPIYPILGVLELGIVAFGISLWMRPRVVGFRRRLGLRRPSPGFVEEPAVPLGVDVDDLVVVRPAAVPPGEGGTGIHVHLQGAVVGAGHHPGGGHHRPVGPDEDHPAILALHPVAPLVHQPVVKPAQGGQIVQ